MRELFDGQSPVGKDIRIGNVTFKVVGALKAKGANMMGSDQDDIILVPFSTAQLRLFHQTNVNDIYVQFAPGQDSTALTAPVVSLAPCTYSP